MTFVVLLAGIGYLTVKVKTLDFWNAAMSFDMVFLGYSWIAFFYACLLLIAVTAKKGMIVSIMRFSFLRHLGIISYGVFLIHMTVDISVHGLLLGKESSLKTPLYWVVVLAGFLVTLLLATLSWRFFEKPVIQWGHSFAYTNKKNRPPA